METVMSLMIPHLDNKRVTVMGLGKFGGGIGAAKYLASQGAIVTVTDLKTERELSDSLAELEGFDIRFVLGRHEMKDMTEAAMLVVSPAVPRESAYIKAARRAGVQVTTEIGLFVDQCTAVVCGITGTNGKSTTVSMLGSILKESGLPHLVGGNIGGSLLSELDSITANHRIALELSSFQLEWLAEMRWSPHIAAVLNVMPDHLDRHGSFENYFAAKASIVDYQKSYNIAVLARDNPFSRSLSDRARGRVVWTGEDLSISGFTFMDGNLVIRKGNTTSVIMKASGIRVPGAHNVINALTASACAFEMGIGLETIARGIGSFKGLPHRLEYIGERNGIRFYNDSKATTPDSTEAGILAFDTPVIPILGGYGKTDCGTCKMGRTYRRYRSRTFFSARKCGNIVRYVRQSR
ncbi:UDP-N-acetylmuramoylalanine--D-glutamate ligase [subsurface metagenome]